MQRKRNIRLLIALGVLILVTAFAFWRNTITSGFEVDKTLFKVTDLENVDEVILTSSSEKVVLKFDGTRWLVNDTLVADRNMIDVLFATLAQAEPKRPMAATLRDSIVSRIETSGVHVSLRTDGETKKEFYAGGNPQKTQAYFVGDDGIPYYMLIPGYRVYVSGIFELTEGDWRDKYVFGFNWRNFKAMTISFTEKPQQNFEVTNVDNFFGIAGVKTDTTRLNDFLDQVSLLTVDQYTHEPPVIDVTMPVVTLSVFAIGDRKYSLELYPIEEGTNYFGKINGSSGAIVSARKINALIRGRDYYILKGGQ